jgi:hypothetical protein
VLLEGGQVVLPVLPGGEHEPRGLHGPQEG